MSLSFFSAVILEDYQDNFFFLSRNFFITGEILSVFFPQIYFVVLSCTLERESVRIL
jgi:hypothetical protein